MSSEGELSDRETLKDGYQVCLELLDIDPDEWSPNSLVISLAKAVVHSGDVINASLNTVLAYKGLVVKLLDGLHGIAMANRLNMQREINETIALTFSHLKAFSSNYLDLELNSRLYEVQVSIWEESGISESRKRQLEKLTYEEYLKTNEWRWIREKALERGNHQCACCPSCDRLQVHHRDWPHKYPRRGEEQPSDLTILCDTCHARIHNKPPKFGVN